MSHIIEDLKGFASLTAGKQKEYFEQVVRDAHSVKVCKMEEVLSPQQIKVVKSIKYKQKECFKNATLVTQLLPKVKYVEGKVGAFGLPIGIDHAWNEYNGKYFDVTAELVLESEFDEYVAFIEVNAVEVMQIAINNEFYGSVYYSKFVERYNIKSKENGKTNKN